MKNRKKIFYLYNGKTVELEPQEGKRMTISLRKASVAEGSLSFEVKIFKEEEEAILKFVEIMKLNSEESKTFVVKTETTDGTVLSTAVFYCQQKFSLRQNCLTKLGKSIKHKNFLLMREL